jgi:hypothetical protein
MSLPFPADALIVPVTRYDINTPPVRFTVPTIPELQPYIPIMTTALANELGGKAGMNPGRAFTYNQMVNLSFYNQDFEELLKLAMSMLELNLVKQVYRRPEDGIFHVAEMLCGLVCSANVLKFRELSMMLDQNTIRAVEENVRVLTGIANEINSLSVNRGNQFQQNNGFNQGNGFNNNAFNRQGGFNQPQNNAWGQPNVAQSLISPGSNFTTANTHIPNASNNSNRVTRDYGVDDTQYSQPRAATVPPSQAVENRPSVNQSSFIQPMREEFIVTNGPIVEHTASDDIFNLTVTEPVKASSQEKRQFIRKFKTLEIHMDRNKHRTTVIGGIDTKRNNFEKYQRDTEALLSKPTTKEETKPIVYDPEWYSDSNIEEAIDANILRKASMELNICRTFHTIRKTHITDIDLSREHSSLASVTTLVGLAKTCSSIVKLAVDSTEFYDDSKSRKAITFVNYVNGTMTNIVNSFLKHNIDDGAAITSFLDDIGDLRENIVKHYSEELAKAFDKFENTVIDMLLYNKVTKFAGIELETEAVAVDVSEESKEDGAESVTKEAGKKFYNFGLVYNCTVTSIGISDTELSIKADKETAIIDTKKCPDLDNIIKSLEKHKREMTTDTLFDILVTSDGVRYQLWHPYLGYDYHITKMSTAI